MLCGTFAFAQKSPAFEAKFKIAEGADLRILDDNIWDYSKTLEPLYVNYNKYTPEQWCNHGSKSFTSAVLKRKADGKIFAIIGTHLWWKSEKSKPGSTMARASQLRLVMAETDIIRAKYGDIPVFVMGQTVLKVIVPDSYDPTTAGLPCPARKSK